MDTFREAVFKAVAMIPKGRVASYGQVAQMAGYSEGVKFIGDRVDMSQSGIVIEDHPLIPFLPANATILFLGSFPPPMTRRHLPPKSVSRLMAAR